VVEQPRGPSSVEAERDFLEQEVERLRAREVQQARTEAALREEAAYVRLLQRVATAANSSPTSEDAMQSCLGLVCAHTGWPVGHVYVRAHGSEELTPTLLWHIADPDRFAIFRAVTERTHFRAGEGLPGRVLTSGEPAWIPDVARDTNFPRARQARDLGVHGAFAFPVLVDGEVLAVLEFFSAKTEPARERMLEVMGHVGAQLGASIDRERSSEEARRSQERYRRIFQQAPVSIWEEDLSGVWAAIEGLRAQGVTDFRRYFTAHPEFVQKAASFVRVLDVNDATLTMLGVSDRSRLLGPLDAVFGGQSLEMFTAELVAIAEGHSSFEGDFRGANVRGERLECHVSIAIPSEGSEFNNLLVCLTDITERRKAEEERVALEAQVRHAQRLESLGVLAGGVAHDFNNLLAIILGNLRLALERIDPGSEAGEKLREVRNAAEHAARLTDQMLTYAGKGTQTLAPLDLSAVTRNLLELLHSSLADRLHLETDLPEGLPLVDGDEVQLRQVILNLVTNAAEAVVERDATLTLRTGTMVADRSLLASAVGSPELEPGPVVFLEVTDPGEGMSRETQLRIFEPFFTTKFSGRGLGLASALGIVQGHRGAVHIESRLGEGTRFLVLLPCSGAESAVVLETSDAPASERGEGVVLVVDDDEPMLRLTALFLEEAGFEVRTALGGRAALDALGDGSELDAVVLDLAMPDVAGPEVLAFIREGRSDLPVVLVSGYGEDTARDQLSAEARTFFVHKPYEPEVLVGLLARELGTGSSGKG
jgi:signal transduction histidine kinase